MPSDDAAARRYDREEVSEILRRAAAEERSADNEGPDDESPDGPGLTLAKLRCVAGEAGIAPERIERAARSVAAAPALGDAEMWGGFRRIERARHFPHQIGEQVWRRMLAEARSHSGTQGVLKDTRGSSREWEGLNDLHVTLDAGERASTLRVTTSNHVWGGLAHASGEVLLPVAALFGIGGFLTGSLAVGLISAFVAAFVGFFAARLITRRRGEQRAREADALLARLSRTIENEAPDEN